MTDDDERTGRLDRRRPSAPGMEAVRAVHASTPQEAIFYDTVVVPRFSALFSAPLLEAVPHGTRGQVLDLGCGTGHPALDLLRRMNDHGRVIAIDRDSGLVDLARRRALEAHGKRVFFKVETASELSFGDEVFDLVVGNLVLGPSDGELAAGAPGSLAPSERAMLGEVRRVLAPNGRALLSRALAGTFEEVLDMLREAALRRDLGVVQKRVDMLAMRYPTLDQWAAQLGSMGFAPVEVRAEEHKLAFRSARDLFADPLVRSIAASEWRWVAGAEGGDALLDEAEKALDTYFAGGPVSLTVIAGAAKAGRPG